MMLKFREAMRKFKRPGGLLLGDDAACNASLWDCADKHRMPSCNHKGTAGVASF